MPDAARKLPAAKPASLKRIDVSLQVAGQVVEQHFDCAASPGCNGSTTATLSYRVRVLKDGQLTTLAGNGEEPYDPSQEGGAATKAAIGDPVAVAVMADGSLLLADRFNNRVRRVDPIHNIWPFAGTGAFASTGDGGQATLAAVGDPSGVTVGKDGSVYVSQSGENRVRRIGLDGVIETFAGTGTAGFSGDGSAAKNATLHFPRGIKVGPDGSLYIADSFNNRVRRVGLDGIIQTVAGIDLNGDEGDGGPAPASIRS